MSNSIKNKLLNHEVAPPEATWDRIAAELPDAFLSANISPLLYNAETAPPSGIWEKISASLDEDYQSERIASKLQQFEVVPPVFLWQNIEQSLNNEARIAPPIKRNLLPFWKYAAAAAVISIVAWGGLKLINNNNSAGEKTLLVASPDTGTIQHNSLDEESALAKENSNPVLTEEEEEARNDAALEASKKVYASVDIPKLKSKVKAASDFYFTSESIPSADPAFTTIQPATENISLEDRYYMMITTEGKVIRMSKKLGHLACCISGENHDTECVNQLKKWQEKLACQTGTNSPGNFMDLLELVSALEEK